MGLDSRHAFLWSAFKRGMVPFWLAVSIVTVLVGGSVLAFLLWQPLAAVAVCAVVLLLVVAEGAYRLQRATGQELESACEQIKTFEEQKGPAIRALREEIHELEDQLDHDKNRQLPSTYWNRERDLLRERLDAQTYEIVHSAFAAVHSYNLGDVGFQELRQKLRAADKALNAAQ